MTRADVNVPHCSAGDSSAVSLVIVQASQKDQGLYHCCVENSYGKATAELNLTTEGKAQPFSFRREPLVSIGSEHSFLLKAFSSVPCSSPTTFKSPGH